MQNNIFRTIIDEYLINNIINIVNKYYDKAIYRYVNTINEYNKNVPYKLSYKKYIIKNKNLINIIKNDLLLFINNKTNNSFILLENKIQLFIYDKYSIHDDYLNFINISKNNNEYILLISLKNNNQGHTYIWNNNEYNKYNETIIKGGLLIFNKNKHYFNEEIKSGNQIILSIKLKNNIYLINNIFSPIEKNIIYEDKECIIYNKINNYILQKHLNDIPFQIIYVYNDLVAKIKLDIDYNPNDNYIQIDYLNKIYNNIQNDNYFGIKLLNRLNYLSDLDELFFYTNNINIYNNNIKNIKLFDNKNIKKWNYSDYLITINNCNNLYGNNYLNIISKKIDENDNYNNLSLKKKIELIIKNHQLNHFEYIYEKEKHYVSYIRDYNLNNKNNIFNFNISIKDNIFIDNNIKNISYDYLNNNYDYKSNLTNLYSQYSTYEFILSQKSKNNNLNNFSNNIYFNNKNITDFDKNIIKNIIYKIPIQNGLFCKNTIFQKSYDENSDEGDYLKYKYNFKTYYILFGFLKK